MFNTHLKILQYRRYTQPFKGLFFILNMEHIYHRPNNDITSDLQWWETHTFEISMVFFYVRRDMDTVSEDERCPLQQCEKNK